MHFSTPRLVLREFTAKDAKAVFTYQSHPRYLEYTPWTERTKKDIKKLIEDFIKDQKQKPG